MIKEIRHCRICGSADLLPVVDLGCQALTGLFPRRLEEDVPVAPLQLVKCDDASAECCGLLQLRHAFDPHYIYGERYGYRSGLNSAMTEHLARTVADLRRRVDLREGDAVIDIGSNDGTLLGNFEEGRYRLIGIDPTAGKFREFYRDDITVIPDFFSPDALRACLSGRKVKLVTALSMFYDLENPVEFMCDVRDLLHQEGLWLIEQSYMPSMIDRTAYDTICHEHLEYYRMKQIKWMADRAGLKIVDVMFNDVNGGSFGVIFARDDSSHKGAAPLVEQILRHEGLRQYETLQPFAGFEGAVCEHRRQLITTIKDVRRHGATVLGYGASTKGNVLLQYCGVGPSDIPAILEINADKFDCYTPGTGIPIVSEAALEQIHPEYLLILPWHFESMIIQKEAAFLDRGGQMIFPLPKVRIKQSDPKIRNVDYKPLEI
ncbi:MAG: methyltransferase domain-containing protein [Candidatus Omnitrophica bacterium]|nr:methyltransferase domain-containing protein [Candidatus Omnitrophota bacterium]MCB9720487.1 methyltransferase domain-containing protein [Candidatus Omnitrophota bacterium]